MCVVCALRRHCLRHCHKSSYFSHPLPRLTCSILEPCIAGF